VKASHEGGLSIGQAIQVEVADCRGVVLWRASYRNQERLTSRLQRRQPVFSGACYENSRRYLSFSAFISARNWMNSGVCRMRFR
jgi:hypothetical protein